MQVFKGKKLHILADVLDCCDALVRSTDVQDRDGGVLVMATMFGKFFLLVPNFETGLAKSFGIYKSRSARSDRAPKRCGLTKALDCRTARAAMASACIPAPRLDSPHAKTAL